MASPSISSFEKKYPYPIEFKVTEFVPELSENNYFDWKQCMLDFIKLRGLSGFIDGTVKAPPGSDKAVENEDYKFWERSDVLVRGWILTMLTKDILKQVVRIKTANAVWTKLEKMFELAPASPELGEYMTLHKAAIEGDWERASEFIAQKPDAIKASITANSETMLIVAVKSKRRNNFVKKLVEKMSPEDLAIGDNRNRTALHRVAGADNIEIAKLLVNKNPNLPNAQTSNKRIPLFFAAARGNREMVLYLLSVTINEAKQKSTNHLSQLLSANGLLAPSQNKIPTEDDSKRKGLTEDDSKWKGRKDRRWNPTTTPFEGEPGFRILHQLTISGLYDIALALLQDKPELAFFVPEKEKDLEFHSLMAISQNPSSFRSGTSFNFWRNLIYSCVPVKLEKNADHRSRLDIENPAGCITSGVTYVKKRLHALFSEVIENFVPCIKHIREKKMIHNQAHEVVKFLCDEIVKSNYSNADKIFSLPLIQATSARIHEIVETILRSCPDAISLQNQKNQSIFHQAIVYHHEKVFNLIRQVEESRTIFLLQLDVSKNNALHLARYLAPQQRLYRSAGAALQMQRELHWFKEVEKLVVARSKEEKNEEGKTPAEIFTDTHKDLVKEGKRWMKDIANACTIIAALIASVVFAAAITVPGGNKDDGHPFFSKRATFLIFAIFDAFALFSSITSVLLFMSILTSRCGEHDFLVMLPKKLMFGLITLFLCMLSTMIAFGATLYLVFGDSYKAWIVIPTVALPSLPVALFVFLKFPLLVDVFKSTYCTIFVKQSDVMLY